MRSNEQAWGKMDEDGSVHPLGHHCADVAATFTIMAKLPVFLNRLETAAESRLTDTHLERLAALVFLHDIGKLHPGFQAKGWQSSGRSGPLAGHLREGWEFLIQADRGAKHPFHNSILQISSWGVVDLLWAIISHHGRPVPIPTGTRLSWKVRKRYDWRKEAIRMNRALHRWFPRAFMAASDAQSIPNSPRFQHMVAGLVALADWIGSDRRFFQFVEPFDFTYYRTARSRATRAMKALCMDPCCFAPPFPPSFTELTGFARPNPAQKAVGEVESSARLVILEAETGAGKTEAALWRFTKLLAAGEVSGLYFAVPTRAAARQLHGRVDRAMKRVLENAPEAVLAIPGTLRAGEFKGQRLPNWRVLWDDDAGPELGRWAAEHATRFLAAPIAIGTIDQAMLAGLQVKHAHLRGSALSRSLLVIDEVHASDSYMTEILLPLVKAHLAVGGHAMLMSATLGSRARVRWTGHSQPPLAACESTPYPAVWTRGDQLSRPVTGKGRSKSVHIECVPTMDPSEAAKRAVVAAEAGARVLVIRNTVGKAVATWEVVKESGKASLLMQVNGHPALHHSRYAVEDRQLLDRAVEGALSTIPSRPACGCVVIGTQTLEQSLDIDADLLITDLCPMDVLLQRIGRLHRHPLRRPKDFGVARTSVMLPENGLEPLAGPTPRFENGLGAWVGKDGFSGIYRDLAVLELTKRAIDSNPVWRIPDANRKLVESTTHPDCTSALLEEKGDAWEQYDRKHSGTEAAAAMLAKLNVLDRSKQLAGMSFPSSDERIMTRLGEEGAILTIDPPQVGPFGSLVERIALPAHWCLGITDFDTQVKGDRNNLVLTVQGRRFRYATAGLHRDS